MSGETAKGRGTIRNWSIDSKDPRELDRYVEEYGDLSDLYPEDHAELIRERDWDYLIVLDACRYDYFEELYTEYLSGDLRKILPAGHGTGQWFRAVFKTPDGDALDFSDTAYVSANPHINSKGIGDFEADMIFKKVVDVWDWGWDKEIGTIRPETVAKAAEEEAQRGDSERMVIHFIQPHAPFIPELEEASRRSRIVAFFSRDLRVALGESLEALIGESGIDKLREVLGLGLRRREEVFEKKGAEGLQRAYKDNLQLALDPVSELVENLDGRIVITADHGEALGEYGVVGHRALPVPWLIIQEDAP